MMKIINNCLKFKQSIFAARCVFCEVSLKNSQLSICLPCLQSLPAASDNDCPQCGLTSADQLCGHCLKSPPAFDATHALFRYAYPLDGLLQKYKYGNALVMAELFGKLLSTSRKNFPLPDLLIPMPLHPQRLQERGFNQAVEIARVTARELKLALDIQSCKRIRFSAPQATLPLKQRVRNMRNAFACERNLTGMKVALVDDVMTTGASLNALATAVRKAGAASIECWVLARTQPRN
ncbi:MAG TPA: phosphoribosyltransferase family protein [Methylophilaceae bacterium]|nr:phosphoribosyltransferase family protein [Methylophilaceae bacterium]